jgi:hypothetical protein
MSWGLGVCAVDPVTMSHIYLRGWPARAAADDRVRPHGRLGPKTIGHLDERGVMASQG